jgi:hypothetical protein
MKIEKILTSNWQNAFRGMRNPYDSWDKSDSFFGIEHYAQLGKIERLNPTCKIEKINEDEDLIEYVALGPEDIDLAQRLIKGGPVHSKFLRQIFISMDITAPLYLWKELDTYKVATTANSCSTMHTIQKTPITLDLFETDDYNKTICGDWPENCIMPVLEELRQKHLEYKQKSFNEEDPEKARQLLQQSNAYWKELIRWLPEGWLQKRTWTGNYETARNILKWRDPHKLTEWVPICDALKSLPFANELLTFGL